MRQEWVLGNLPVIRRYAHFSRQSNSRIAITEIKVTSPSQLEVLDN
jgi:hypothetical protein